MPWNGKFILYCTSCGSSDCSIGVDTFDEFYIICNECENEYNQYEFTKQLKEEN